MSLNTYFQAFYITLVCLWLLTLRLPKHKQQDYDKWLFIFFSALLVCYVVLRPFGVGLDDLSYLTWVDALSCATVHCGKLIQGERDKAWYSIIGILKSIYEDPRIDLFLTGFGLSLKLWVISRLCRLRLLALISYLSLFYIIHDITALRVSLAIAVYLFGINLLVSGQSFRGAILLLTNGLFHQQAYLSSLALLGCLRLSFKYSLMAAIALIPMLLLCIGIYPNNSTISIIYNIFGDKIFYFLGGFTQYSDSLKSLAHTDYFKGIRLIPIVAPPTLVLAIYMLKDLELERRLYLLSFLSIIIASLLLWIYAVHPIIQTRLWDFFLVPIVFIVGNIKLSPFKAIAIITLSTIYILKYTAINDLLLDQKNLIIESSNGGKISLITEGIPCDKDCSARFPEMTNIDIKAEAYEGYRFDKWLHGCSGEDPTCTLAIKNEDLLVDANFIAIVGVNVSVIGDGRVTSSQFDYECTIKCTITFDKLTQHPKSILLTPEADYGSHFVGWDGACKHNKHTCIIQATDVQTVIARFEKNKYNLAVRSMSGRVYSTPLGIDCRTGGGTCSGYFSDVTIFAEPAPGFRFSRWIGCLSNTHPICSISLTKSTKVIAEFIPDKTLTISHDKPAHDVKVVVSGPGKIFGLHNGIACHNSTTCHSLIKNNTALILTAVAKKGHYFVGWSGACAGREETICRVQVEGSLGVGAIFH